MITSSQRTSAPTATAALVSVTLLLAGCSGSGTAATEDSAGDEEQPGGSLVPEAEGAVEYPLTLDTVHGEIEIAERPERVAVMGHSAIHDAVAALGVTPVYAAADRDIDFGWTDPAWLDGIETLDVQDGNAVNVEGVAAAEPDLIFLPNTAEMFAEEDLARLADIAPVLEAPDVISGDQVDWRDAPQMLGEALDLSGRAEDAIREADEAIEATSEEHPEFDGRTITLAYDYGEEFGIDYYTVTDGTRRRSSPCWGSNPTRWLSSSSPMPRSPRRTRPSSMRTSSSCSTPTTQHGRHARSQSSSSTCRQWPTIATWPSSARRTSAPRTVRSGRCGAAPAS